MCIVCNKPTNNPKFCSRSCSTTYNNLQNPRRTRTKICAFDDCNTLILSSRTFCYAHKARTSKYKTIGELRKGAGYQINAYARSIARGWAKKNIDMSKCSVCGYKNHVEVCHIIPLASFPDETPISETYTNNVVGLCPNHHWEFDHGMLTL